MSARDGQLDKKECRRGLQEGKENPQYPRNASPLATRTSPLRPDACCAEPLDISTLSHKSAKASEEGKRRTLHSLDLARRVAVDTENQLGLPVSLSEVHIMNSPRVGLIMVIFVIVTFFLHCTFQIVRGRVLLGCPGLELTGRRDRLGLGSGGRLWLDGCSRLSSHGVEGQSKSDEVSMVNVRRASVIDACVT